MYPRTALIHRFYPVRVALLALGGLLSVACPAWAEESPPRPNILWLDAEDANVNWFGSYGNPAATTPNVDQLAAEGFRYTHSFADVPVCSPQRATWITGVRAVSLGTLPMRSRYPIPHDLIRYYPDFLREAGYFAIQPGKTDYNIGGRPDREAWDEGESWRDRPEGKPFFHKAHFGQSHESSAFGDVNNTRHDPAEQRLRAYHPDIPDIRNNYAHYADAVENMDTKVGEILERLERDGLADDTIVIFTTDHGGVMPASKRFLTDSGIHAPLIVRIPEKFKHLWPADQPGMSVDRIVSFVDLPKTVLSIAGATVPDYMQGRIFLGPDAEPPRDTHFAATIRLDERFYNQRVVRSKNLIYIKNYTPYISTGQRLDYLWRMTATQAWENHHREGKTDEVTGAFFQPMQPVERLHDTREDPDNVVNLVDHPDYQDELETMRAELRRWQLEVYDTAVLPEREMEKRARQHEMTIYELARDPELYDLPTYLDSADLALKADPLNMPRLIQSLEDDDSGVRYWAAVGLLMLGDALDDDAVDALASRLDDDANVVRAIAAWALLRTDEHRDAARSALIAMLENASYATVLVLNIIEHADEPIAPYRAAIEAASFGGHYTEQLQKNLLNDR